jgi:4'-phosphopantetheinyl transferase
MNRSLPTSDQVHVWWIDLGVTPGAAEAILSPDERARAARFRYRRDGVRWIRARAVIRQILAGYLGLPPPDIWFTGGTPATSSTSPFPIAVEEGGGGLRAKPALVNDPRLRFNFAHSGDRAVLAVAWEREVGVDLEPIDADLNLASLLTAACTPAEIAHVEALSPDVRIERFLTLWTVKEAYLKAIGLGIFREPRTVEVALLVDGHAMVHDPHEMNTSRRWDVRLLDAGAGWVAALAVAGSGCVPRRFTWPHADATS